MFSVNGVTCPKFVALHILFYLEPQDLVPCFRVCKIWNKLAADPSLWQPLLDLCKEEKMDVKDGKVWTLIVTSPKILRAKIENICKGMTPDHDFKFRCYFLQDSPLNNQNIKIDTSLKKTKDDQGKTPVMNINLFLRKGILPWLILERKRKTKTCIFVHTNQEKNKKEYNLPEDHSIDWRKGDNTNTFGGLFTPLAQFSSFNSEMFDLDSFFDNYYSFVSISSQHFKLTNITHLVKSHIAIAIKELKKLKEKRNPFLTIASIASAALSIGVTLEGNRTLGQLTALVSWLCINKYFK